MLHVRLQEHTNAHLYVNINAIRGAEARYGLRLGSHNPSGVHDA
jgi:hypothetical protein